MNKKLYIFEMDCGVYGNIVVIEETEEKAKKIMEKCENYIEGRKIFQLEITQGLLINNLGD